ncbi:hypothetical protein BUALT_Bualt15G0081000 [Buddleja alternifolia]|uniref:Arginine and glutamate-rich protein 1 n=1 Tax=Buddleja alternifolia TaxID=168488 RepID=A0AAV6WFC5_9LAMI|nr:hypothetical protein BUALT_Bualt15G0081000 [Buddleja alternifolia]
MGRDREISRSPSRRRRYSPSPSPGQSRILGLGSVGGGCGVGGEEEESLGVESIYDLADAYGLCNFGVLVPYGAHSLFFAIYEVTVHAFSIDGGRRSPSLSSRRYKSRSPTPKRRKSRSPTPKRNKRQRKRSTSSSPLSASPSVTAGTKETKDASEKLIKEEEEKKRRQQEAELKLIEEETAKRVAEAIHKKVEESLNSEEIKLEIEKHLQEGRKKLVVEVAAQLEKEKEAAIIKARQKEAMKMIATFLGALFVLTVASYIPETKRVEQAQREKEELERLLEENRKKVEEAQRREALEQQRREEERYRELEERQRQKEEALRRKKEQEEEERANQMKLLGKNKTRPKLSFALVITGVSRISHALVRAWFALAFGI